MSINKSQKIILFSFILLLISNSASSGQTKSINYKAILTNNLSKITHLKEFKCEDKIILYFSWLDLKGNHFLKAYWYKPGGKLQETTEHKFNSVNKKLNTWLWLKLNKGKNRGFIVPESGGSDFIGEWFIEIFLDGEFLEKKRFQVIC